MARIYFDKLSTLTSELRLNLESDSSMEVKHFFSGAALYVNKNMCVSLSPVGLAFKLSAEETTTLINSGEALPLKYFAKGHVKKDWVLFDRPDDREPGDWKQYFLKALTGQQMEKPP